MDKYLHDSGPTDVLANFFAIQWLFIAFIVFIVLAHLWDEFIDWYRRYSKQKFIDCYLKVNPDKTHMHALQAWRRRQQER
jgi:hypothetical protein